MSPDTKLLLHVSASEAPMVADHLNKRSDIGVVLSGRDVAIKRARIDFPDSELILDLGGWRDTRATPGEPFALNPGTGLFDLPVAGYVDEALDAGFDTILAPVAAIGSSPERGVRDALDAVEALNRTELQPTLAIPQSAIPRDRDNWFTRALATYGRPVNLIPIGSVNELARPDRLDALRRMVRSGKVARILATDPLAAADVFGSGGTASTGISSPFRIPNQPGRRPQHSGFALPAVFVRELLQTRGPMYFAEAFAARPGDEPYCEVCGSLIYFEPSPAGRARVLKHNLHALCDFSTELQAVPSWQRPSWLEVEVNRAVGRSPNPAMIAGTVLAALKELNRVID